VDHNPQSLSNHTISRWFVVLTSGWWRRYFMARHAKQTIEEERRERLEVWWFSCDDRGCCHRDDRRSLSAKVSFRRCLAALNLRSSTSVLRLRRTTKTPRPAASTCRCQLPSLHRSLITVQCISWKTGKIWEPKDGVLSGEEEDSKCIQYNLTNLFRFFVCQFFRFPTLVYTRVHKTNSQCKPCFLRLSVRLSVPSLL